MSSSDKFLSEHNLLPSCISPAECSKKMAEHMMSGLNGHPVDMPMIPTYIRGNLNVPFRKKAVVIDAGGTNYRCALAYFDENECKISGLKVCRMPGTEGSVTWEEFVSFVADSVMPFIHEADVIGFCFSYNADITPEMDGIVHRIDKEVVITGCEGKLIGASVVAELEKRGIAGKKVIILNDTVAALLGGSAVLDKTKYSDFIGMICGTGINTCAPVAIRKIGKLNSSEEGTMLINLESGYYSGMPMSDVDTEVDLESNIKGEKMMEKMCSGAYIGSVCRDALRMAAKEGYLPEVVIEKLNAIERFDGAVADAFACGEDQHHVFNSAEDLAFAKEIALAIFERSARCMATNILALMLINDSGKDAAKPACVCAEGSLISRSRYFLSFLRKALDEVKTGEDARFAEIVLGHDTTLPGSAVAALINA